MAIQENSKHPPSGHVRPYFCSITLLMQISHVDVVEPQTRQTKESLSLNIWMDGVTPQLQLLWGLSYQVKVTKLCERPHRFCIKLPDGEILLQSCYVWRNERHAKSSKMRDTAFLSPPPHRRNWGEGLWRCPDCASVHILFLEQIPWWDFFHIAHTHPLVREGGVNMNLEVGLWNFTYLNDRP